ncbi:MAG: DinB family protein [Spirochaetes bacterium]|nr:DinB family protein [Spirochaetota bacterium]
MDLIPIFRSQYLASLSMLEECLRRCPETLWVDPGPKNAFWRIAYHALHYTNLYLADSLETFVPWVGQRPNYHFLGPLPWSPQEMPKIGEPYDPPALLDYLEFCRREIEGRIAGMDFSSPSGFHWLPFNKAELQIYNIRHLQHHAGQLADRLRGRGLAVPWIAAGGPTTS